MRPTNPQAKTSSQSPQISQQQQQHQHQRQQPSYLSTPPSSTIARPTEYLTAANSSSNVRRSSDPGLPTPPTKATPAIAPPPAPTTGGTRKKHVSAACSNCRLAHAACDNVRPCERCIRLGKEDTCMTPVHRKRGRKSNKQIQAAAGRVVDPPSAQHPSPRKSPVQPLTPRITTTSLLQMRFVPSYDDMMTVSQRPGQPGGSNDGDDTPTGGQRGGPFRRGDTPLSTPILPHTLSSRKRPLDAMTADTNSNIYTLHQPYTTHNMTPQPPQTTTPPLPSFHQIRSHEEQPGSPSFTSRHEYQPDMMVPTLTLNPFEPPEFEREGSRDRLSKDGDDEDALVWHIDLRTHRILHDNRHIYHLVHPFDHPAFTNLLSSSPSATSNTRIHLASPHGNAQRLKNVTLIHKTDLVATIKIRDFWVGEDVGTGNVLLPGLRQCLDTWGMGQKRRRMALPLVRC